MSNEKPWKTCITSVIDASTDRLNNISKEIWSTPEIANNEFHAHEVLTGFLAEEGFEVERNYIALTGFRATFRSSVDGEGDGASGKGLHVCFLCQYDAVVGVGHASGHNLGSEATMAAALGIKTCLKKGLLKGKVTVLGSPAEDSGEGCKVDMIEAGAFNTVDFAMILAPLNHNILFPRHLNLAIMTVSYKGKAAHASAYPWEGRNALDAAVSCYNNVGLMRQQMKPTWSINGIITKGGVQANVIPEYSELKFWLRSRDAPDLVFLQHRFTAIVVAAAKATGCEATFEIADKQYHPVQHNEKLGEIYQEFAMEMGMKFDDAIDTEGIHIGSTDLGNVSQVVPCLSPSYDIGTRAPKNSIAFHEASGTPEAHENTLTAAKAMTFTAAAVLEKPELLSAIRDEYVISRAASGNDLLVSRKRSTSMCLHT